MRVYRDKLKKKSAKSYNDDILARRGNAQAQDMIATGLLKNVNVP